MDSMNLQSYYWCLYVVFNIPGDGTMGEDEARISTRS